MRFVATVLMWLVTTILLAVAIPAVWAQRQLIDDDGYSTLAQQAAGDASLQSGMAAELAAQVIRLGGNNVNTRLASAAAATYTAGPSFPEHFAQANRFAHRWLFTNSVHSSVDSQGRWIVDIAPMLADASFTQTLSEFRIKVPSSLPIPLTEQASSELRPGRLQTLATWGPWASYGLAALAGLSALLTFLISRRGKTIAALGVSGLLVGAAGWVGIELGRERIDQLLNNASGNIRQIAQGMVNTAEVSMHQWLNVTLIAGGGLVVLGIVVSLIAGLFKRKPATGISPTAQ